LYQIDPSGAYYEWKATAIGRNSKNAKNFLEKRYNKDMEIEDVLFIIYFYSKGHSYCIVDFKRRI
jgi:20S proteasome alpha/beta subunit